MKIRLIYSIILVGACQLGCDPTWEPEFPAGEVEGFAPIYVSKEEAYDIRLVEGQPIENAGKLYLYGNLLLINEIGKGVHMIDNTNPASPVNIGFLKVPGSHDMVIKGDVVYVNNYQDLVALKIEGQEVKVTERISDVMNSGKAHPIETGFYFDCVDDSKGVVIGWKKTMLNNPNCYR